MASASGFNACADVAFPEAPIFPQVVLNSGGGPTPDKPEVLPGKTRHAAAR
jgi:hypothetical protein